MLPALLIRLRPNGPWRFGPQSGARDRVHRILHSDSLFSAVTQAIAQVGSLEEWLDETARSASAAVRFTSLYPYMGRHMYITPPRSIWPPATTGRVRWKGARLLPISLVQSLLRGESLDEQKWAVDPVSECLLPVEKNYSGTGPFRVGLRSSAAVDRLTQGNVEVHTTACLEFADQCGLWCSAVFRDDAAKAKWAPVLRSAFKFLADEGMGGERSRGWGRAKQPRFEDCTLSALFFPGEGITDPIFWMLSLYNPAEADEVDWSQGKYTIVSRSRHSDPGRQVRFAEEGSVIGAGRMPVGRAHDISPAGSPHPVYRSGLAVAVPIPSAITSVSVTLAPGPEEPVAPPSPELPPLAALVASTEHAGSGEPELAPEFEPEAAPEPKPALEPEGEPEPEAEEAPSLEEPIPAMGGDDWNSPSAIEYEPEPDAPAPAPDSTPSDSGEPQISPDVPPRDEDLS